MEFLFQQTNNELHQTHLNLNHLERATNENAAQPILQSIYQQINLIEKYLVKLDQSINKELATKRRPLRYRYDQLKFDFDSVVASLNILQSKLTAKWQVTAEREELFCRKFTPNETHVTFDDSELLINNQLKQSHTSIDELIAQGSAVLSTLRTQHLGLSSLKSKIRSVGETLGLSSTTLRIIEKRLEEDWLLFLILVVVCLIFMYCFYRYWKG